MEAHALFNFACCAIACTMPRPRRRHPRGWSWQEDAQADIAQACRATHPALVSWQLPQ